MKSFRPCSVQLPVWRHNVVCKPGLIGFESIQVVERGTVELKAILSLVRDDAMRAVSRLPLQDCVEERKTECESRIHIVVLIGVPHLFVARECNGIVQYCPPEIP